MKIFSAAHFLNLFTHFCVYLFHKTIWAQYVEVDACAVEDTEINTKGTDPKKLKNPIREEKRELMLIVHP